MSQKKKAIREAFRKAVFSRDKGRCRLCGELFPRGFLDAHHITPRELMPNGGYVPENGITLCSPLGVAKSCHMHAEEQINNTDFVNNLYKLINSSYEKAYEASEKLQ